MGVPLVGAALDPLFGADGLIAASLVAYALLGPLLYLLLRQLFSVRLAGLATGVVLLLDPVREWATWPLTDAWGLAVECAALATALLALRRGAGWIPIWAVVVPFLSFTRRARRPRRHTRRPSRTTGSALARRLRDRARSRSARSARLRRAATRGDGVHGHGFNPPAGSSWSFVLGRFLQPLRGLVRQEITYLLDHPVDALVLVGGFLAVFRLCPHFAGARAFVWGAALASLAEVLILPNYSAFRLELVVVPFSAIGLAALSDLIERPQVVDATSSRVRGAVERRRRAT